MKSIRTGMMAASLAAGVLLLAPARIQAQVLEKVSISSTMYVQGAQNDNGTTTTTKAPSKSSLTTVSLLKQLAADEFAEGNLPSASLPPGARLDFNGTGFEVDQGTNELVDASDILTWTVSGQNDISAGNFSDVTGQGTPPFSQTDYYLVTVAYASPSNSIAPLTFTVTGLATVTGKAAAPNVKTGTYTQSASLSLADGTGEGTNVPATGASAGQTTPFVLTGFTLTASGSATGN